MRSACFLLAWVMTAVSLGAQSPVYVVLWFDTEDYIEPAADDAALRIATELTARGVPATFKIVGEKARTLEARGRMDVIRALSNHGIGYHSNWHSIQPTPAVYLQNLGYLEGAAEFERREAPGVMDLRRIFGVTPVCYGQPGSSWGPQSNLALRRLNIPVYLDEGAQVGIDDQPFWFGGMLYVFNMGRYLFRPDLDRTERNADMLKRFDATVAGLSAGKGGLISSYYHPTEFVCTKFWDAVNFANGATRERSEWQRPPRRSKEDSERAYRILTDYVDHARRIPGLRFVTALEVLQLYESRLPKVDRRTIAEHLKTRITFLRTADGDLSAADMLQMLLGLEPQIVEGPTRRAATTYRGAAIPRPLFERAKEDAASFIRVHHVLPASVFVGSAALALPDFAATLAGDTQSGNTVSLRRGNLEVEKYFSTEPVKSFSWAIHPENFSAPELLELARLQGWTLKPARLR